MYDPKFEKAIQQKMEELEFRPPESIWVNIEKAVVVKRRRRAGFIWRYLLPAVIVAAAAGIFGHYEHPTASHPTASHPITGHPTTGRPADGSAIDRSSLNGRLLNGGSLKGGSSNGSLARRTLTGNGSTTRSTTGSTTRRRIMAPGSAAPQTDAIISTDPIISTDVTTGTNKSEGRDDAGSAQYPDPTTAGSTAMADKMSTAGQKGLPAWFYQPGLADQRLTPQVHASTLNTRKSNAVALAGLSHPQRYWEAGFVAGGGLSRLNRLNSDQAQAAVNASATSLYTIAGSSSSKQYISYLRPGASFDGGIYLQRALSDRWIFNTGMDLHYYSNRISVGQQVTTYVAASASYFIPTTTPSAVNQSMYSAGNTRSFTNKYYFLELPVGLQWKVNKSHLLPIFVEGGVSLSRLMGASALFYDAKTGFYSKDGDIVNKTQFNISSALLVGLPFHGVNIQVGPQILYGLTPLVNTQGAGDQHLLYTGIRLVVIPGRK